MYSLISVKKLEMYSLIFWSRNEKSTGTPLFLSSNEKCTSLFLSRNEKCTPLFPSRNEKCTPLFLFRNEYCTMDSFNMRNLLSVEKSNVVLPKKERSKYTLLTVKKWAMHSWLCRKEYNCTPPCLFRNENCTICLSGNEKCTLVSFDVSNVHCTALCLYRKE